jgi:hypothetical protein
VLGPGEILGERTSEVLAEKPVEDRVRRGARGAVRGPVSQSDRAESIAIEEEAGAARVTPAGHGQARVSRESIEARYTKTPAFRGVSRRRAAVQGKACQARIR